MTVNTGNMASLTFIIVFCLVPCVAGDDTYNSSLANSGTIESSAASPSSSDDTSYVTNLSVILVETTLTTYDSGTTQSHSGAAIITTIPMRALWKTLLIPLVVVFKIR